MAGKNLDLGAFGPKLKALGTKLGKYTGIIFVVGLLGMYSFLVFRINNLTTGEPSEDAVAEKLQTVARPRIDESAVDKIEQLEDNSTEVKSLFDTARDNPFHE